MSAQTITTEAELAALAERTAVVDHMGDVGTVLGGMLRYPETTPQTFERAAKKYGPFTVVYEPPAPEWKPGTTGTAQVVSGDATDPTGRVFRKVRGMVVHRPAPINDDMFVTIEGEMWALEGAYCTGFVPDATAPTLAQIVDAMCAHDPEGGNGEVGTHDHSHDPEAGQCYWASTVGPQIASLWIGGAS